MYTNISDLAKVKDALSGAGFEITSVEISRKPINVMDVDAQDKEKIINFLSTLESMDDVQKVYSNISLA